jgi:NAD(P)-dependent dehydrogenase (short-subunit alcohol dehydrogenase family)
MNNTKEGIMKDLFSVKGKTVVITGGSRGIGLMMARGFVENGAKVYITSRKADACRKAAAELSQAGGACMAIPSDLSREEGVKAFAAELKQREKKLDVLINNAGKTWGAPLEFFPDNGWDSVFAVNLKSVFNLTRECIPLLAAAGNPDDPSRIINIGSVAAYLTDSMSAYSYGTSKAAVHHLTKTLARELAPQYITVNAIAPGRFPTAMTVYVTSDKARYDAELAAIPLHRYGKPEDIAGLAVFLASRAASFMTGNIIPLDGGSLISGKVLEG